MSAGFEIRLPRQRMVLGAGCVAGLEAELADLGVERALVISGPHLAAAGITDRVVAAAGLRVAGRFLGVEPHSPVGVVQRVLSLVAELGADGIVSVGGGSAHDTAKGAALLRGEGGGIADHRVVFDPPDRLTVPRLRGPRIPVVTVNTTLSAAEMTSTAGYTDAGVGFKMVVADPLGAPRLVLLDAELASTTPPRIMAASGCNAIDHCVEAIYSRAHQPVSDALALPALATLVARLPAACSGDHQALADCQAAAYMSGLALQNTSAGISHAICHVLGVRGVSHGEANAIVTPKGLRFNLPSSADRQALMARSLGLDATRLEAGDLDPVIAARLERLAADLGLPARLRDLGVGESDLPAIAADVMHERHLYFNPRAITGPGDVLGVLQAAW